MESVIKVSAARRRRRRRLLLHMYLCLHSTTCLSSCKPLTILNSMKYHFYNRIFLDPPLRNNFTCFSQFEKGANYLPSSLFPFKKTHHPKSLIVCDHVFFRLSLLIGTLMPPRPCMGMESQFNSPMFSYLPLIPTVNVNRRADGLTRSTSDLTILA